MNTNKKIPTDQQTQEIISAREQDILIRGEEHSVYDINGKIVTLKAACLWYDNDCRYIKPKSAEEVSCIIN
tara:strand:- start:280 stop:492 length:213 start_codon:yes stop_codon:yes gene_type:complete